MAAKVFTVGAVTFNSVAITGIRSINWDDVNGNVNRLFCDGDIYSQFLWLENLNPMVTIVTTDLVPCNTWSPGDKYTLVSQMPQRAAGIGGFAAGSTALQNSMTNAMLITRPPNASQAGESSLTMTFNGISTDGTSSPVTLSLAAAS